MNTKLIEKMLDDTVYDREVFLILDTMYYCKVDEHSSAHFRKYIIKTIKNLACKFGVAWKIPKTKVKK